MVSIQKYPKKTKEIKLITFFNRIYINAIFPALYIIANEYESGKR